ncbi:MAG TPA: choice-of-anchor D domain-containing protein, partial [Prosthecobacter sp.]|nr:choice-of-anchor D domain-containing protein [Prosthecobacter sp.]
MGASVLGAGFGYAQEFQASYDLNKAPGAAVDAPNVKAYGKTNADNFGRVIRSGDVNGDGIDDLIVGTPGADAGTPVRADAGAVYVWLGAEGMAGMKDVAATAGVAPDVTILGATAGDQLSRDGALLVMDVNGDGVEDLLIGALLGDGPNEGRASAGEAYLVYGRKAEETFPAVVDLGVRGSTGANVTIFGSSNDDQVTIGGAMAVGDVNGDGINDLLLGSVLADGPAEGRLSAGEAYVVFGRTGTQMFPTTLDLAIKGDAGASVTLYGATGNDFLTFGGAIGVGDVNEDGLLDIILGARDADGPEEGRSSCGEAYLVFGRAVFPLTLDLGVQGNDGADVTLYGASSQDQLTSGGTLAVGDVNGDGFADLLLGALGGDGPNEGRASAGEAYIISGREAFPLTLDLAIHGSGGASATIYGASVLDGLTSGGSLAVGDVNGDGFTDLLLGAPLADGPGEGRTSAGEAYIVLGGASFPATMDLNPDSEGDHADVTVYGASPDDNLTIEGALTVGDVDGDGAADLLLGARLADGPLEGRNNAGEAYVVLGRNPFPSSIDLAVQGVGGADVTVYGATGGALTSAQDQLTSSAALSSGDVDGDGFADFIVGAIAADGPSEGRTNAGEAYVIFGTGSLAIAPDIAVEQPAGTNIPDGGSRFGSILIGANATRTFTIKNTGLEVLTDLEVGKDGLNADDYTLGNLPTTALAPGTSLTFTVTFTPSAVGSRSATLRILSNDPNENPFDIVLTGTGTAPEIEVEQPAGTALTGGASHSFGTMHTGGQAVRTFTIRNSGSADLTDLVVTKQGSEAAEYAVGPLGTSTLPTGASTTFTVTFAPTGLGTRNATLSIASNDADENPFVVEMTGIGKLPEPEITVQQPAGTERLDLATVLFGAVPVGTQDSLTITVKNTGSATLAGL